MRRPGATLRSYYGALADPLPSGSKSRAPGGLSAADANRSFYSEHAATYDLTEHCVVDPGCRSELRQVLAHALAMIDGEPRALDACGGSGNAAEALVELGVDPVVVDISAEMLSMWREKARARGVRAETITAEIFDFLQNDARSWNLIVFSSALHHLENYRDVVSVAIERLLPGGVIVTIFDPTELRRAGRWLRRLDWIAYLALHQRREFAEGVRRRLRRATEGGPSVGAAAEWHAMSGLDDLQLRRMLERRGLEVIEHARYVSTRLPLTSVLMRLARSPNAFRLMARKPRIAGGSTTS
jgi:ubiquinone/menaquinone biosynthesis C-methylase UbiE